MEKFSIATTTQHVEKATGLVERDPEELIISAAPFVTHAEAEASKHRNESVSLEYARSWRFMGTLFGLGAVVLGVGSSYNIPTSVLTAINNELGPSVAYSNITILWTIMCATALILMGRLSDLFGRRYFLLGSIVVGFIGAVMSGEATSIPMLVGAQIFTGPAAPSAAAYQLYIGELVPIRHRGYWNPVILIMAAPVQQFGPVIVAHASWRWIYRISAILWVVAFVLIFIFYHPPAFDGLHTKYSKKSLIKRFDWVGVLIYTAGLVLFCFGLSWGGGYFPWQSQAVIATIVVGAVLLFGFFFWEAYAPLESPLVNVQFLVHQPRKFLFPLVSSTIGGMFFYGAFLIWPIEIATVYTDLSPIQQGWYAAAIYAAALSAAALGNPIFQWGGQHRLKVILLNVAMVAFTIGASQCSRQNRVATTACFALAAASAGAMEACFALWIAATRSVENIGLSLGILGSFRNVAGAVASAIYISVLNNQSPKLIGEKVTAAALSLGLPASSLPQVFQAIKIGTPQAFAAIPGITPAIVAAVPVAVSEAFHESFKTLWYIVITFGVVGLIFSLLSVKDISENMTNHQSKSLYHQKDGNGMKAMQTTETV